MGRPMHKAAKKWDRQHGDFSRNFDCRKHKPPKNRPCDWCGEIVDEGFIHEKCVLKECEKQGDVWW